MILFSLTVIFIVVDPRKTTRANVITGSLNSKVIDNCFVSLYFNLVGYLSRFFIVTFKLPLLSEKRSEIIAMFSS